MWSQDFADYTIYSLETDPNYNIKVISRMTKDVLIVEDSGVLITVSAVEDVSVTKPTGTTGTFSFSDSSTLYEWMDEESCTPLPGEITTYNIDQIAGGCGQSGNFDYFEDTYMVAERKAEWLAAGEIYRACYPRVTFDINPNDITLSPTLGSKL